MCTYTPCHSHSETGGHLMNRIFFFLGFCQTPSNPGCATSHPHTLPKSSRKKAVDSRHNASFAGLGIAEELVRLPGYQE